MRNPNKPPRKARKRREPGNPLEKVIEGRILAYLTNKGILCWKNDSVGLFDPVKKVFRKNANRFRRSGVSDILGMLPNGRFLAIEVKAKDGKVSEHQSRFIDDVTRAGGMAFIARSVDDVHEKLFGGVSTGGFTP